MTRKHTIAAQSSDTVTVSGGFAIKAVRVDNLTNQWLQITGQFLFIRPYTYGEIDLMAGLGSLQIGPSLPPGATSQAAPVATERYIVTIYDAELSPQPGIPGQINIDTYVATHAFSTSKASLGAGTGRDVLATHEQAAVNNNGGARRVVIKARSTNAASVYVLISSTVITGSGSSLELTPGEGIVIAYPWWATANVPAGASWGQLWFDGAVDVVNILVLGAP